MYRTAKQDQVRSAKAENQTNTVQVDTRQQLDPWAYVMENFGGLIMYYAKIYAAKQSNSDYWSNVQDYESDIRICMVDIVRKYHIERGKPLTEVTKMLKSAPYYYYSNKFLTYAGRAKHTETTVLEFSNTAVSNQYKNVCEVGDIAQKFDYYYELFVNNAYKLSNPCKKSDEFAVLSEILAPSDEYREFSKQYKRFMSMTSLREFFRKCKNWKERRFINTIGNMKYNIEEVILAA